MGLSIDDIYMTLRKIYKTCLHITGHGLSLKSSQLRENLVIRNAINSCWKHNWKKLYLHKLKLMAYRITTNTLTKMSVTLGTEKQHCERLRKFKKRTSVYYAKYQTDFVFLVIFFQLHMSAVRYIFIISHIDRFW